MLVKCCLKDRSFFAYISRIHLNSRGFSKFLANLLWKSRFSVSENSFQHFFCEKVTETTLLKKMNSIGEFSFKYPCFSTYFLASSLHQLWLFWPPPPPWPPPRSSPQAWRSSTSRCPRPVRSRWREVTSSPCTTQVPWRTEQSSIQAWTETSHFSSRLGLDR